MSERDDMDMLAAEYVLGTLDADERQAVAVRRADEPDLDRAIERWEARLAPMLERTGTEAPSADLFDRIRRQIDEGALTADVVPVGVPTPTPDAARLARRVTAWRWAAGAGYALAACLAMVILFRDAVLPPTEQRFVAVFQDGDQPPRFVMAINLETRELTVRPIAAEDQPGKTYQLWIASDRLGPAPRSLGLLERTTTPTRKQLDTFDPDLLEAATFGISLEPEGGSPTGQPTGTALHGHLIPATP